MIRVTLSEGVATITLARPDRRNALTPELLERLIAEIPAAAASAGALLLTGDGKCFCAGFDLSLCRDDHSGAVMRKLLTELSRAVQSLRDTPAPVVIAAHGAAVAGGCALLGGGDIVVTNDEAVLGYPVTRMGISPAVSAPFLRQAVGDGPCRERMLDSGLISGREAARIGLADECTGDPDGVLVRAGQIAAQLAAKPKAAIQATKRWLNEISPVNRWAGPALDVSLGLAGSSEERTRLSELWKPRGPT